MKARLEFEMPENCSKCILSNKRCDMNGVTLLSCRAVPGRYRDDMIGPLDDSIPTWCPLIPILTEEEQYDDECKWAARLMEEE